MLENILPSTVPLSIEEVLAVPQTEVASSFPSAQAAVELVDGEAARANETRQRTTIQPGESLDSRPAGQDIRNRAGKRRSQGAYRNTALNMVLAGAHYAATLESGTEAAVIDGMFAEAFGPLQGRLGTLTPSIMDSVPYVRTMKQLTESAAIEIRTVRERGAAAGYWLTKALATNVGADVWREDKKDDWPPSHMLARLAILGGENLGPSLSEDLRRGAYDEHIAADLLCGATTDRALTPEMERVQWLNEFAVDLARASSTDPDFSTHVASLVARWPFEAKGVVVNAQEVLLAGMGANLKLARHWLDREQFLADDSKQDFERLIGQYLTEYTNRAPVSDLSPTERQAVFMIRASSKRRGGRVPGTSSRKNQGGQGVEAVAPASTVPMETLPTEPLQIVTCLQDGTVTEGVEALVTDFVRKASQGEVTVKEDLGRVLEFMARTDLPEAHPRGVKPIQGTLVRLGDERHKLWEMKPTDAAADLALHTRVVKDARVYFVKLPDGTLGVVGIEPRSKQTEFLRGIRAKTKRGNR